MSIPCGYGHELKEWMNEWVNEWVNGWVNGWMNEWIILVLHQMLTLVSVCSASCDLWATAKYFPGIPGFNHTLASKSHGINSTPGSAVYIAARGNTTIYLWGLCCIERDKKEKERKKTGAVRAADGIIACAETLLSADCSVAADKRFHRLTRLEILRISGTACFFFCAMTNSA